MSMIDLPPPAARRDFVGPNGTYPRARCDSYTASDTLDRLARVYPANLFWYELRDGCLFRVTFGTSAQWSSTKLLKHFRLLDEYGPEGAEWVKGFLISLDGITYKLPSRTAVSIDGLAAFFTEREYRFALHSLKHVAEFFDLLL